MPPKKKATKCFSRKRNDGTIYRNCIDTPKPKQKTISIIKPPTPRTMILRVRPVKK
jgi:hypothetical protein